MRTELDHRQRMKARFCAEGLEHFDEVHALELLLFYAVPRIDTKPIARRLLDVFGSLPAVLEADMQTLQKVEGVGPGIAAYLHLLNETQRYCLVHRETDVQVLRDLNQCGQYLVNYFHGQNKEVLYLLCLDAKCKVLGCRRIGEGVVDGVNISTRQIVDASISAGATSVILAHNHPGGVAMPSPEDQLITRKIGAILAAVDVVLVDHIIVADGDFISMAQTGAYYPGDVRIC